MDAMIIDACKMYMLQGSFIMAGVSFCLPTGSRMSMVCHVTASDGSVASSENTLHPPAHYGDASFE